MTRTALVGIVNLTPDSFFDGGKAATIHAALAHAHALIDAGADVLDIGAESTRPHATPLTATEEIARLRPVLAEIIALCHAHQLRVSLDTRHAATAAYGIETGVEWINDVSGGEDRGLLQHVAESHVQYVFMHSLGIPANPHITLPQNINPCTHLREFFTQKIEELGEIGIPSARLIIDAGLGFGKTAAQSLALLWDSPHLQRDLGCPVLVGHSRKSLFSLCGADTTESRLPTTLLASHYLMQQEVAYIRIHDVQAHQQLRASF